MDGANFKPLKLKESESKGSEFGNFVLMFVRSENDAGEIRDFWPSREKTKRKKI